MNKQCVAILILSLMGSFLSGCSINSRQIKRENAYLAARPASERSIGKMNVQKSISGSYVDSPQMLFQLDAQDNSAEVKDKTRLIHYEGFMRLKSSDPQGVLQQAEEYVKKIGGYVESLDNGTGMFRVPVASFNTAFNFLLTLAPVMSKNIHADDISDAFKDNELRIKTIGAAIERLKEVLKQAKDDKQRLRLLKELKRLSEELESLQTEQKRLSGLATFSRITITIKGMSQSTEHLATKDIRILRWIYSLGPFRTKEPYFGRAFTLTVPDKMLNLELDNGWFSVTDWAASSPGGSEVWTHVQENNPMGDSQFWIHTLKNRFESEFSKVDEKQLGKYKVLRMVSHGVAPYIFWIGVTISEGNIYLVECYFPNIDEEKKYASTIEASITKGAQ